MASSGTVGQTVIDTAKLFDHAWRRCGLQPQQQTPELIASAKESLFMLLVHLASRGLNLWAVEKNIQGLVTGQGKYVLPDGTIDLLNVLYAFPTRTEGTDTSDATSYTTELAEETTVVRVGVRFTSPPTGSFLIESSDDGITWATRRTITSIPAANVWGWYDLDPIVPATYFRVSSAVAFTSSDFYLCSSVREQKIAIWNRDDYSNQPNKTFQSRPSTNFFFEKALSPSLTLWPLPNNDTDHLVYYYHHQVEDVGSLQQSLAIPARWYDAFLVHLSFRLSMELPGVAPDRIQLLSGLADQFQITAEGDETDKAPIMMAPRIGCYTA